MKRVFKFLAALMVVGVGVHAADIQDLSTTDASNTTRFPESMAPSQLNNSARALEGILARWYRDWNGSLATGGSANTYTLSANQTISSYFDGLTLVFEVTPTNTGASTINVDTVGAATLAKYGTVDLDDGDLTGGTKHVAVYDGSRFQLLTPVSPVTGTITSGNVAAFAGTSGKLKDSGYATTALAPVGAVISYAGSTAPSGWLFPYGQAISRTTYSALFAVIGTTYGSGDGSTTFNLPDLRGRVVAGQDDMGGTSANRLLGTGGSAGPNGDTLGATGGAEMHTLTIAEMPAHTHDIDFGNQSPSGGVASFNNGSDTDYETGSTGGGGAHNNVQPTIILNKIIYTGVTS